jgi:nuclear pore complex protein Nup155
MTFRDLIVIGGDMTTSIASALVRRYLDENTSTDAICRRLHELCPTIFRHENSLQAQAHEMILQSRTITDKAEKERIMNESVTILKKIGSRLDLNSVCDLLHSARAFKYIVDICLFVADKRDPLNYANYHQTSRILNTTLDEAEERARLNAVSLRMECYMRIIETLDRLMNSEDFSEVFQACVKSTDEIFHTKLYEWLCEKNLSSKLLEVQSPFIESFLKKKAESDCYSTHHLDLMWRFYERRGNFYGAAQILDKLACKPSTDYELEERLAYLSRAKSCVEAMASPGEYLHELEEKMEVVRIQIQVFRRLKELPESHAIQESLNRLNYSLSDLTQLYQDYAQKFNLYDCQLAILKCGNHHDPSLVEKLWKCIIDEVYNGTQNELPDTQLHILGNRIENLGKTLMPSERFFPAYFIIAYLEYKTYIYDNLRWVPQCLMRIGFKPLNLLEPYHKFYKSREHSVYWPGKQIHALRVIATLIEDTLDRSDKSFTTACLDVICDYLIDLQTMAPDNNVRRLQDTFTVLQKRINERMLK